MDGDLLGGEAAVVLEEAPWAGVEASEGAVVVRVGKKEGNG